MVLKKLTTLISLTCKNKEDDREMLKRELSKQINDKMGLKEVRKLDIQAEVVELEKNQQIIKEIKKEKKDKKEENIKNNVEMWNLQHKMRVKAEKLQ